MLSLSRFNFWGMTKKSSARVSSSNQTQTSPSPKKGVTFRIFFVLSIISAILLAYLVQQGYDIKTVVVMCFLQFRTGMHGFFGLGLLAHETLSSHPISEYVPLGYTRSLKLKYIYFSRYWWRDNYLYDDWLKDIHREILGDLEERGAKKDKDQVYEIPNYDFSEIDPIDFFNKYVKLGRPAILRNVKIPAMNWSPDKLAQRPGVGDFHTPMRCMDGSVANQTLRQYVASRVDQSRPCYFDNNANIFEAHPELEAELEIYKFSQHMSGKITEENKKPDLYLFSQMFMSVFQQTGALFHCANYNNLFIMIRGRKKWTFVDPSNTFLLYPFFNTMMKDAKSYLTWHVTHSPHSEELIKDLFPLYRYLPKYEFTLEPGDVLINPPWNWHMVENQDDESIGIATRWRMAADYPYTNGLFSFLQFTSSDLAKFFYWRILSLAGKGTFVYKPTAHGDLDTAMNFGKWGSVYRHRAFMERIVSATQWRDYLAFLAEKGRADRVDYLAAAEQ